MTKFTIDVSDDSQVGLQFAMDRYNSTAGSDGQIATMEDFIAYIVGGHGQDYASQKRDADLAAGIASAKAGDATALKAVADVIATAAQAAKVDPQPEPAIPANPV